MNRIKSGIDEKFDSLYQSPEMMHKLHILIERLDSNGLVSQLDNLEKNLNSRLIALANRQNTMPNMDKIERLFNEIRVSSKLSVERELESVMSRLADTRSTGSGGIVDAKLLDQLNEQIKRLRDTQTPVALNPQLLDKLTETGKRLEMLDTIDGNVSRMHKHLASLSERVGTESKTFGKLIGSGVSDLLANINSLESQSKSAQTKLDTLLEMKDRLAVLIEKLSARMDKHANQLNSRLEGIDDDVAKHVQPILTKLTDLTETYDRLLAELKRSEGGEKLKLLTETSDIKALIDRNDQKLFSDLKALIDRNGQKLLTETSGLKTLIDQKLSTGTSDLKTLIDQKLSAETLETNKLIDRNDQKLLTETLEMKQLIDSNDKSLLETVKSNQAVILEIRDRAARSDELSQLSKTMDKLVMQFDANRTTYENLNKRLDKLDLRIEDLSKRIPTNVEFWNNLDKFRDAFESHSKLTAKDLTEMLDMLKEIKTNTATNNNAPILNSLEKLESRVTERLVKEIRDSQSPKALDTLMSELLKSKSLASVLHRLDLTGKQSDETVQILKRLEKLKLDDLNASTNAKLTDIAKTLKEQLNAKTVIDYIKKNVPGDARVLESVQSVITKLEHNDKSVKNALSKLDAIAETISRPTTTQAQLQTILQILNGDANDVTDKLPNLHRELSELNRLAQTTKQQVSANDTRLDKVLKQLTNSEGTLQQLRANDDRLLDGLKDLNRCRITEQQLAALDAQVNMILKILNGDMNGVSDKFPNVQKEFAEINRLLSDNRKDFANLKTEMVNAVNNSKNEVSSRSEYTHQIILEQLKELKSQLMVSGSGGGTEENDIGKHDALIDKIDLAISLVNSKSESLATKMEKRFDDMTESTKRANDTLNELKSASDRQVIQLTNSLGNLERLVKVIQNDMGKSIRSEQIEQTYRSILSELAAARAEKLDIKDQVESLKKVMTQMTALRRQINRLKNDAVNATTSEPNTTVPSSSIDGQLKELTKQLHDFEANVKLDIRSLLTGIMRGMEMITKDFSPETINSIKQDVKRILEKLEKP